MPQDTSELGLKDRSKFPPPFTAVGEYSNEQVVAYIADSAKIIASIRVILKDKRYMRSRDVNHYTYYLRYRKQSMKFMQSEFQRRKLLRRNAQLKGMLICFNCKKEFNRRPTSNEYHPVCYPCSHELICEYSSTDICVCFNGKCKMSEVGTCATCGACSLCLQRYQMRGLII